MTHFIPYAGLIVLGIAIFCLGLYGDWNGVRLDKSMALFFRTRPQLMFNRHKNIFVEDLPGYLKCDPYSKFGTLQISNDGPYPQALWRVWEEAYNEDFLECSDLQPPNFVEMLRNLDNNDQNIENDIIDPLSFARNRNILFTGGELEIHALEGICNQTNGIFLPEPPSCRITALNTVLYGMLVEHTCGENSSETINKLVAKIDYGLQWVDSLDLTIISFGQQIIHCYFQASMNSWNTTEEALESLENYHQLFLDIIDSVREIIPSEMPIMWKSLHDPFLNVEQNNTLRAGLSVSELNNAGISAAIEKNIILYDFGRIISNYYSYYTEFLTLKFFPQGFIETNMIFYYLQTYAGNT